MDVIENISKQVMDICNRAKKQYHATITTNAYLLTPKNIELLLKYNVYNYYITVDGLKETHDNQRILTNGDGTFDKIISNLEFMRDNIKSRKLNVTIRTNITKSIMDIMEKYYDFYDEKFGNDKRFSLFIREAGDWGGERINTFRHELIDDFDLDEAYERLSKKINRIKYDRNFMDMKFGGATCSAILKNKYTISTEGLISKCDTCDEYTAIGKILNGRFCIDVNKESVWTTHQQRYYDDECDNCFFSYACLKNTCPKAIIDGNKKVCYIKTSIDKLLLLLYKSYRFETI